MRAGFAHQKGGGEWVFLNDKLRDMLEKFGAELQRNERERLRTALLDEAAQWTGDFRMPVHKGLCDAAKRAGVPLTLDECYQATKRA